MRIIEKAFATKQHGVAGFLSYPERTEPGPALFLIHPKGGLGEYIKTETRKFARLGYTTFAINVFEQLGYPEPTHIVSGSQIQAKTPDPEFTRVLTEGWRFLLKQPTVNKSRVAVCGYCNSFCRGNAGSARVRRLLPHGSRGAGFAAQAGPSLRECEEDSLPIN